MHADYLSLFESPVSGAPIAFQGLRHQDDLWEGILHSGKKVSGHLKRGIAIFEPSERWKGGHSVGCEDYENLQRNWDNELQYAELQPDWRSFCDEISRSRGYVLELAAGPRGGHLASVLTRNPKLKIVVNDLDVRVLDLWRGFLAEHRHGGNCAFAAFDARNRVFKENSLSAISSRGGFLSMGNCRVAAGECYRALEPGGALYSIEIRLDREDWERLPADLRTEWESRHPYVCTDWSQLLQEVGFELALDRTIGWRELDPEEGGPARLADEHGLRIQAGFQLIKAVKPGDASAIIN